MLRLIVLNQSLWLDEATTAKAVHEYGFTRIISEFSLNDFHPPLYYFLMKVWTNVFGYSEVALRFPSIIFSLLTGYVVYKIAKLLNSNIVGLWSAVFFLFNPLIMYYSQEARMYMMATFFLTICLYYFIKLLRISKLTSLNIFLFNLFSILSFYTFYGSIFLIASLLLYLIYKKKYRLFFLSLILNLLSFFILSPLLFQQFTHARESLQIVTNWSLVLGKVSLKNLLLIPLKFSIGRISFDPKIVYYTVSGLWTLFVFYFAIKGGLKNKLLLYLFVFPLVIGFIFSFFSPLLQYFRFLYLIPLMGLLLAISAKRGMYDRAARVIIIVGFFIFTLTYLLFPQFHREDWKSLAYSLKNTHLVYMILPSSDPIRYYAPTTIIKELRYLEGVELVKEVTVIPYTADIYGFNYKKKLEEKGFTYKNSKNFRGVWYETWVKNKNYAGSFRYSLITAID